MSKIVAALIMVCSTMMLSGCWDNTEVERNGFVLGAAIDLAEDEGESNNLFRLTSQVAIPAKRSTQMKSGGGGKPYVNMTLEGDSLLSLIRGMSQQSSRVLSFQHLKVVVISSEVAQRENFLSSVLDLIIRDMQARRNIKILISDGEIGQAKQILEVEPEIEELPSLYIDDVSQNHALTLRMLPPALIGDVQGDVLEKFSYVIPKIHGSAKNHLKYNGAAVIRGVDNKMVGVLKPDETLGLNLITQKNKNSVIQFKVDDHQMTYELELSEPHIDVNPENPEQMTVNITIETQGRIAEMYGGKSLLQKDYLERIQDAISTRIEDVVNKTVDELQNDLNTDVLGIGEKLRNKHPNIWNEIQSDWDKGEKFFANANIHVKASAEILDIGATDKTKNKRKGE